MILLLPAKNHFIPRNYLKAVFPRTVGCSDFCGVAPLSSEAGEAHPDGHPGGRGRGVRDHSDLNDVTGLANAAFTARYPTVIHAISSEAAIASMKTPRPI